MSVFAGTGRLVRLALRRDRIQLPVWLAVLGGLLAAQAAAAANAYADPEDRLVAARIIAGSPALLLLRGPAADASLTPLAMAEAPSIVTLLGGLMSALAVVRHTRQNEETGRAELVGSAAVGRSAMLAAAVVVGVGASVVLGVLYTGVLLLNGLPVNGALAAGAAMGAVGVVFAGVAAVTAQLAATARAAGGLAISALAAAYLVRGIGDVAGTPSADGLTVTPAWPLWFSPFGWAEQVRLARPDWTLLAPAVALASVAVGVAIVLAARRDLGFGLIPPRRGPPVAARGLLSPLGLAWRQQRGLFVAWAVGLSVVSAALGSLGKQVETMAGNEQLRAILDQLTRGRGGDLADQVFRLLMTIVGMAASVYAVQALLALRAEEADGRLEPILGTAVSRVAWIRSHITCAVLGVTAILGLAGASAGLTYGLVAGDLVARVAELVPAAVVQVPAVLVLAGVTVAIFGLLPRRVSAVAWTVVGAASIITLFGDVLEIPEAVRDLSPFAHVPTLPIADVSGTSVIALLALASAATLIGVVGFQRRDLAIRP